MKTIAVVALIGAIVFVFYRVLSKPRSKPPALGGKTRVDGKKPE